MFSKLNIQLELSEGSRFRDTFIAHVHIQTNKLLLTAYSQVTSGHCLRSSSTFCLVLLNAFVLTKSTSLYTVAVASDVVETGLPVFSFWSKSKSRYCISTCLDPLDRVE